MKQTVIILLLSSLALGGFGCEEVFRFAPNEQQKQSALLTNDLAKEIEHTGTDAGSPASRKLVQGTTATAIYYGLPKIPADPEDFDTVTAEATKQSMERPDPWVIADHLFELGLGITGVLGGVGAAKVGKTIAQLRAKAKALQEVVRGNELLKENGGDFKMAHRGQSAKTTALVAEIRAERPLLRMPQPSPPPREA